MTRDEMIEILIEDRLSEWVYAQMTDGFVDMLRRGWKGYDEYTDKELQDLLNSYEFDSKRIKDYQFCSNQRLEERENGIGN